MHGKSGTMLILNLSPMSEEDAEQERLRYAARHSEKITSGEQSVHDCPGSDDDVLSDFMDGDDESSFFSMSEMPRFAKAMGATDEEIDLIRMEMALDEDEMIGVPESLSTFKRDYDDYRKYGGDVVAMELMRDEQSDSISDADMDDLLSVAMGYGMGNTTRYQ